MDFGEKKYIRKYPNYKGIIPDGGMINCTLEIIREEGMQGLWVGYSACAARALIANLVMFAIYEPMCKKLKVRDEF